ncbi:hypothetical protein EDF88_4302 [Buttiauxella sp. BIGb0552]|uniref:hypothetical protein n=1 Tax=Buttiauxella sp. BIGb0552 TaxID=2485120 RepID=UPI0010654322|nr:hypothetical protein [Buttiauxella sp. BIGb0552]TDX13021.1 hypothetical protein EDF88_4302 [Buttiauxella sp. BIGb0552]
MGHYPITTNITEHNNESAKKLFEILSEKIRDRTLVRILNIDLSFIDYRATSSDYIVIQGVEYLYDNTYCIHYTIDYSINNGCKDMYIEDEHETSMNFDVYDVHLDFDLIENVRNTVDEF